LIDILYNGILAGAVLMWVVGTRHAYIGRVVTLLKRHVVPLSVILWIAFAVFAFVFVTNFDYFDRIHDIDEAVEAAATSYEQGINPYEEYVIPRFKTRYVPGVDLTMGPYNYLPVDLYVYVGFYEAIGTPDSPVWFVVTNLLFSGVAFALFWDILKVRWVPYAPIAGIVMLFYSFDNASLTLLLMVLAMYAYTRLRWHPGVTAIVFLTLATLTKIFAAIPLVILILHELQRSAVARNWRSFAEVGAATAACAVMAVVVMLPFGVQNVLDAAVFFHTSEELRVGTSCGGTLLSELMLGSEYYSMISGAAVLASLVVGMRMRSLNDRVLLTTVVFLLVSVKSSLAPLMVAGVFLTLRLKEMADARDNGRAVSGGGHGQPSALASEPE
jgi:hypothetical protein